VEDGGVIGRLKVEGGLSSPLGRKNEGTAGHQILANSTTYMSLVSGCDTIDTSGVLKLL
jgi:hypothetical protein